MEELQLVPSTRVFLWTAPRCLSSVFERSVRELSEVKVIFESHHHAYYLGPERKFDYKARGDEVSPPNTSDTYDSADEKILRNYDDSSAVFTKNMGSYIPKERFSTYVEGKFANFKHTFLIRNPREANPSMWRAMVKSDYPYPCPVSCFAELCELFEFVLSRGKVAAVIDAADLMRNPERVMQHYCAATGLQYDKKMLTWSPGVVEDWTAHEKYKEWHWNAMFSSGFNVGKQDHHGSESYPPVVEEEIQKDLPHYEVMYKHRTVFSS